MISQPNVVSKIIKNKNGKTYLEVDGKPFLYNAIQSWYPPEKDYTEYIKKSAEAHFTCFSFWLYWRQIEPLEGEYDWTELDKIISLANQFDIRLDIIWAGTNFCGHLDPRFTPHWVMQNPDFLLKDENGGFVIVDGGDIGTCHVANYESRELLKAEQKIVSLLIKHLKDYDTLHRIIAIQVENEINMTMWNGGKQPVLRFMNEVAGVVKQADYKISTRANIFAFEKEMDEQLDVLENIDGHGLDTYSAKVSDTRKSILDERNTKFKYIAENAAWENSTSHIVAALANGGFYNIYKVDYDICHKKPGIYNAGWEETAVTKKVRQLNFGLKKIASTIAISSKSAMAEFNTSEDLPLKNFIDTKELDGRKISFFTGMQGAVGLVVLMDGDIYLVSDDDAQVCLSTEGVCTYGYMDDAGIWNIDECLPYKANELIPIYKGIPLNI